jgi:hypothetical protein
MMFSLTMFIFVSSFIILMCFFVYLFFETGFCYVAQPGLKLSILLSQPPECWDYRRVISHLGPF